MLPASIARPDASCAPGDVARSASKRARHSSGEPRAHHLSREQVQRTGNKFSTNGNGGRLTERGDCRVCEPGHLPQRRLQWSGDALSTSDEMAGDRKLQLQLTGFEREGMQTTQ